MQKVIDAALKKSSVYVIRAELNGVDLQDAIRVFLSIQDHMEDTDDWPEHEYAVLVETFFNIEGATQEEVIFSIQLAHHDLYNDKAKRYIMYLFRVTLDKLFKLKDIYSN